jgi:hypothetical protein
MMRNLILVFCFLLLAGGANSPEVSAKSLVLINRIEGRVYDPNRLPVVNAYVELLNDVDSMVARTKTEASGRFTLTGMPPGRYNIKVLPLGTNLAEQTQEVQITNMTRNGSDTAYVDFYLRYDKRGHDMPIEMSREVIFAQEIPSAAKKLYDEGVNDLPKNQEKGLAKLEDAIKIFPNYYDALKRLGQEYVARKDYKKGYPYLLRAIDVNQRSFSSYYSLGYAFYQLKEYPAALAAIRATTVLAPESIDAQLLQGTLLRITENYTDAEKALLKADTLAKQKNAEVHWQLALLYNRLNRNQDAVNELETFLKLEPDSPDKKKIHDLIAKLKGSGDNHK